MVDNTFRYLQIFSAEDFSCRLIVPSWCLANKYGSKYICCNSTYIGDFKFMKEHRPGKKKEYADYKTVLIAWRIMFFDSVGRDKTEM